MSMMKTVLIAGLSVSVMAACTKDGLRSATKDRETETAASEDIDSNLSAEQVAAVTAITRAPAPKPVARAAPDKLDTTTAEQRAAAAEKPASGEQKLGNTVASLGNPSEGGFWIKTPLVKTRGVGRIENPENGKSAKVDLIPLDKPASGGSQVSLPALQLIGVSLTDLPTLVVYKS